MGYEIPMWNSTHTSTVVWNCDVKFQVFAPLHVWSVSNLVFHGSVYTHIQRKMTRGLCSEFHIWNATSAPTQFHHRYYTSRNSMFLYVVSMVSFYGFILWFHSQAPLAWKSIELELPLRQSMFYAPKDRVLV